MGRHRRWPGRRSLCFIGRLCLCAFVALSEGRSRGEDGHCGRFGGVRLSGGDAGPAGGSMRVWDEAWVLRGLTRRVGEVVLGVWLRVGSRLLWILWGLFLLLRPIEWTSVDCKGHRG